MRPVIFLLCVLPSLALVACGGGDGDGDGAGGAGNSGGTGTGGAGNSGGAGNAGGAGNSGGAGNAGGGGAACDGEPTAQGEGTYYDATGSGNCSFDPSPNDLWVAAMNQTDYAESDACGRCVTATGPKGTVTVRIVDRCPECQPGDIDFSPQAFEAIADLAQGRVDISWKYVPCSVSGAMSYRFKEGSSQWWTAVQVRNHLHGVAKFERKNDSGAWVDVPRENYNYFVDAAGMGVGPYSFRLTDVYGATVEENGIAFAEAQVVPGGAQFPACAP